MELTKKEKLEKIIDYVKNNDISAYIIAKNTKISEAGVGKILNKVSTNPHEITVNTIYDYLFPVEKSPITINQKSKNGDNIIGQKKETDNQQIELLNKEIELYKKEIELLKLENKLLKQKK